VSPDAHSPAERADAVLRAAEAAAAAARTGASEPPPEPAEAASAPPPHGVGAPARLLAAAAEFEAGVAQARAELDALDDALERVGQSAPPSQ
jgi:hypothetical protein